ncbi:hypothetical protein BDP27DRAFT_1342988 [Rhodocollybia butyracea]|uniref:Protein-S-isoprenylcysteine O-methyltransferase n=1 Tax=Rhodocollybia butyracea TaxID=206335 RepID=A0A9P5TXZ1_9AGAR|nr:hypothetical protein BDP27DRAFT_1342988 [Rhodocollybia butyracea]
MATSGLISIPLIFSAVVLQHQAWTGPNGMLTTPRRDYTAGFVEKSFFRSLTVVIMGQKIIAWLVGGAEIAGILARNLPSWSYSHKILSHLFLRLFSFQTLGTMFTFEVSIQKHHKLVTSGPYSVVRHPVYSGGFLMYAGLLIWQSGPSSVTRQSEIFNYWGGKALLSACIMWMATTALGVIHRMTKEDDLLQKEFGNEWAEWASHTSRLIPWVY